MTQLLDADIGLYGLVEHTVKDRCAFGVSGRAGGVYDVCLIGRSDLRERRNVIG